MTANDRHPLAEQIRSCLPPSLAARYTVCAAEETVSTNTDLKQYAAQACADGAAVAPTVLLARAQSGGRGRMGRSFLSPGGTGLYMSILLTPDMPAREALLLTTATAVACAEAAESLLTHTGASQAAPIGIKWVNDLYLHDKKICGILAEASLSSDSDTFAWAVIGIGINLAPPSGGFPKELSQTAGALLPYAPQDPSPLLCRLAAEILLRLDRYLSAAQKPYLLDAYRRRSVLDGRAVSVRPMGSLSDEALPAVVRGIDDDFGLQVVFEDGTETVLTSGEVLLSERDGTQQSARPSVHLR